MDGGDVAAPTMHAVTIPKEQAVLDFFHAPKLFSADIGCPAVSVLFPHGDPLVGILMTATVYYFGVEEGIA